MSSYQWRLGLAPSIAYFFLGASIPAILAFLI